MAAVWWKRSPSSTGNIRSIISIRLTEHRAQKIRSASQLPGREFAFASLGQPLSLLEPPSQTVEAAHPSASVSQHPGESTSELLRRPLQDPLQHAHRLML